MTATQEHGLAVTGGRPAGTVAVCMWDIAGGGMTMLRVFWTAARQATDEHRKERGMGSAVEMAVIQTRDD